MRVIRITRPIQVEETAYANNMPYHTVVRTIEQSFICEIKARRGGVSHIKSRNKRR